MGPHRSIPPNAAKTYSRLSSHSSHLVQFLISISHENHLPLFLHASLIQWSHLLDLFQLLFQGLSNLFLFIRLIIHLFHYWNDELNKYFLLSEHFQLLSWMIHWHKATAAATNVSPDFWIALVIAAANCTSIITYWKDTLWIHFSLYVLCCDSIHLNYQLCCPMSSLASIQESRWVSFYYCTHRLMKLMCLYHF